MERIGASWRREMYLATEGAPQRLRTLLHTMSMSPREAGETGPTVELYIVKIRARKSGISPRLPRPWAKR